MSAAGAASFPFSLHLFLAVVGGAGVRKEGETENKAIGSPVGMLVWDYRARSDGGEADVSELVNLV